MLNINRIMVPLDLHEKSSHPKLIEVSIDLAKQYDAQLIFVYVVDIDFDSSMIDRFSDMKSEYASMAEKKLRSIISEKIPKDIDTGFKVLSGRSYSKIVDASKETKADLILIAAHKPGMKDFLLGMTAARVVRHASCSVMVIRE